MYIDLSTIKIIPQKLNFYSIYIDSLDERKLYKILYFISKQNPSRIEVVPSSDYYHFVLKDYHVKLLQGIHHITIPQNYSLTHNCLQYLYNSKMVDLGGCYGINLYSLDPSKFKTWGWGVYPGIPPKI